MELDTISEVSSGGQPLPVPGLNVKVTVSAGP
jgi:hypothetical protein